MVSWIDVEEMRLRLQTNLEIAGVPPFWEDHLFAEMGDCVQFQLGGIV